MHGGKQLACEVIYVATAGMVEPAFPHAFDRPLGFVQHTVHGERKSSQLY